MRAKFLYRKSFQFSFPITLKSFLIHFLEKHISEVLDNILLNSNDDELFLSNHFNKSHLNSRDLQIDDNNFQPLLGENLQFHLIFQSHFTDQQQHFSLDIDTSQMNFEDVMSCMERNMEHLQLQAPVSGFTIVATSNIPEKRISRPSTSQQANIPMLAS